MGPSSHLDCPQGSRQIEVGKMLASGKKWNKGDALIEEATWQARQPTTKGSNGFGGMSFAV